MKRNKALQWILVPLLIGLLTPTLPTVGDDASVAVSSVADWASLARDCTLDVWSQGKTVSLTCDIDFTDASFTPIPTFGGVFLGNGHTVSGVSIAKSGSYLGLFRHIQPGGSVTDLTVKASLTPSGSRSFIGGVAGENNGRIERCVFDGDVEGADAIGGIAGSNGETGTVASCAAYGMVTGENETGGIVGKNSGFVTDCENNAQVNTVYEEKKTDLSGGLDVDAGAIMESYQEEREQHEEDSVLGHTDTGGVAGYTSGVVQGCVNRGAVGYPHVGYNVGGIAGRQSGYLLGCRNEGLIQGRKDVGGIAGQAEPHILLDVSEDGLGTIHGELDRLYEMMDQLIRDADNPDAERYLTGAADHARSARESAETLMNEGTDFLDDNLGEINAQTAILSNALSKLPPVLSAAEQGGAALRDALRNASDALGQISLAAPELTDEIDAIRSALTTIANADAAVDRASMRARRAISDLEDAVVFRDQTQVRDALTALGTAMGDMAKASQDVHASLTEIERVLQTGGLGGILGNSGELQTQIRSLATNVASFFSSLRSAAESVETVLSNTEIDFDAFQSAAKNLQSAVDYLSRAVRTISTGLEQLSEGVGAVSEGLESYLGDVADQINVAKATLSNAMTEMSYATDDIRMAIDGAEQIVSDLADEKPLTFVKTSDAFRTASENLFDSLAGVSDEIGALRDNVMIKKDQIAGDLSSVLAQVHTVLALMIGEIEEVETGSLTASELFQDVSDEDVATTKQGKIADSRNAGSVEADRNAGGIAGAMAIEYAKDPEDDLEKPTALRFAYRTRAVLQGCVNDGDVTGKKDCTGGVVGLAELGTVFLCENYGAVESTNGDYVGGVVGRSDASVRRSFGKSKAIGSRYVGGIAGKAESLTGCYAVAHVEGEENVGAIAGESNALGALSQNYYVDQGLGAVDGVSYRGRAEAVSFDALRQMSGIPLRLISFTVTFLADGAAVGAQSVEYGESTRRIRYPGIPEKEGYSGKWTVPESETVTEDLTVVCTYQPYITLLASRERNGSGKLALALAEGNFTDEASLSVAEEPETTMPEDEQRLGRAYRVKLEHTSIAPDDDVTVRLLNENRGKATVWRQDGDRWEKLDVSGRGKYVTFQIKGTEQVIYARFIPRSAFALALSLCLIGAAAVAAALVWLVRRRKRKRANA